MDYPLMVSQSKSNRRPDRRQFSPAPVAVASITLLLAQGATSAPGAHGGVDETLRIGLIGCGGRGTGAAIDALHADPHTKLVAIGDAFADRAAECLKNIQAAPGCLGITLPSK